MLRLILPYIILFTTMFFYIYFRYRKLGSVIMKFDRVYFCRYNLDSHFLVVIIGVTSFLLARYQLSLLEEAHIRSEIDTISVALFYLVLLMVVVLRELERPSIRQGGISSPRGFWLWSEVKSYSWSKNLLRLNLVRNDKKKAELWLVSPAFKKEINDYLKKMVKHRNDQSNSLKKKKK